MDRKAFHLLLKRYLDGSCSPEERRIIDQWYDLLDHEQSDPLTEIEISEIENRLWNNIRKQKSEVGIISSKTQGALYPLRTWMKYIAVAALLAALIAGFRIWIFPSQVPDSLISHQVQRGLLEVANHSNGIKPVKLEDGSSVELQPGSIIAFPAHFLKNKREVYLAGEAFFEVTKNAGRPFFVYNKKLVAEVLGTSFNIKIIKDEIEVAVKTGRVAVFENGQQINLDAKQKIENGVIITPNQKVTYYEENRHFITSIVDKPAPVADNDSSAIQVEKKFVFDDEPISEVLKTIEKSYEIEIILENENLGKCPFTGDISKQSLFNKLELVCQVFQASYEIKGTMILIKGGKGCN
jgi:transmembrane sensor